MSSRPQLFIYLLRNDGSSMKIYYAFHKNQVLFFFHKHILDFFFEETVFPAVLQEVMYASLTTRQFVVPLKG